MALNFHVNKIYKIDGVTVPAVVYTPGSATTTPLPTYSNPPKPTDSHILAIHVIGVLVGNVTLTTNTGDVFTLTPSALAPGATYPISVAKLQYANAADNGKILGYSVSQKIATF